MNRSRTVAHINTISVRREQSREVAGVASWAASDAAVERSIEKG
jgi:hypothetical protein